MLTPHILSLVEEHARQVIAALGVEPTWAKAVTVVDEDVDIYDMDSPEFASP